MNRAIVHPGHGRAGRPPRRHRARRRAGGRRPRRPPRLRPLRRRRGRGARRLPASRSTSPTGRAHAGAWPSPCRTSARAGVHGDGQPQPAARQRLQGVRRRRRPDRAARRTPRSRRDRRRRPAGLGAACRRRRSRASRRRATSSSTPMSPGALAQARRRGRRAGDRLHAACTASGATCSCGCSTGPGSTPPAVVAEQGEPDPDFPTVAFPNPEEPGAMDLLLAARPAERRRRRHRQRPRRRPPRRGAVPTAGGPARWLAPLTGDEIGVAARRLAAGATATGADRLVATTIVSSSMLGRLAAGHGVAYAETLTGFKWLARAALDRPDLRFVYAYEEALGSCVGDVVRDKDGISAALAFAELAAAEQAPGRTVLDRLDDLARALRRARHPPAVGPLRGPRRPGRGSRRPSTALAASPPGGARRRAGRRGRGPAAGRGGLPPSDVVRLRLDGVRLIVRPSGTEPKLKAYAEAVVPVGRRRRPGRRPRPGPARATCRGRHARGRRRLGTAPSGRLSGQAVPNRRSPASPRPGTMKARSSRRSSTAAVTTSIARPDCSMRGEALGRGEHAHAGERPGAPVVQELAGVGQRAAGGQHRVEHEHRAAGQVGGHLESCRARARSVVLVAGDADEGGVGVGQQPEDGAMHPEPGPQDGHDERRARRRASPAPGPSGVAHSTGSVGSVRHAS